MTKSEFQAHMALTFHECQEISARKNADYAGDSDPFANFRIVEHIGLCSVEKGIVVRMTDKLARISNLLERDAQVLDESVSDTLSDIINYAAILKAYLYDRASDTTEPGEGAA
jgi:hypothetical protein